MEASCCKPPNHRRHKGETKWVWCCCGQVRVGEEDMTEEDSFVRARENIWLMARNLLRDSKIQYSAEDILDVAIFLAGDAITSNSVVFETEDEDDSEHEEGNAE